jgi:uncharacterized secreted protein with C-terminal beta-propeller domain
METKMISKILLTLTLAFVLGSTITQANGDTQGDSVSPIGPPDQFPVVTINTVNASVFNGSIEDVTRGKIGVFVLSETPQIPLATTFVNFKVSGTAIPGVDYVPLVSPASIRPSLATNNLTAAVGFGVILVKTLPDPRASVVRQAQTVVVTLEPGPGYTVGQPSKSQILIEP